MIDTKALREKVLDLAIRGKLVPQDPDDEPASVLLERIRAEKEQMVKDGKPKAKDIKNDTIIFKGDDNLHYEQYPDGTVKCIEDEIPFSAPKGWSWCRLRDLFNVCSAKRVLQSEWRKNGVPFYRAREIVKLSNNGYVDNDLFISEKHYQNLKQTYGVPQSGDLMVTGVGTIGKVYIVKSDDVFYYKDASVLCFENRYGIIAPEYARIMIESPLLQNQIYSKTYGNTVDTITISTANEYLCILPPIKEQTKIIKAVNNSTELISTIENNKSELSGIVAQVKSKILDLAIRGKLVPQNPDDEPASVLLERIRAEKEQLIKQGKIKRDKKESAIFKGEDNSYYEKIDGDIIDITEKMPFDIPNNSIFIRLKCMWELLSGRDLAPDNYNDKKQGIPYITGASNFNNGKIEISRWTQFPQVVTKTGDLLITCKGTVGEMAFNDFGDAHIARQIMAIRNIYDLNIEYLSLCVIFYINSLKNAAKGLIPGISREDILNLFIPLYSEQYQATIVNRVNELFSTINDIEKSLS